MSRVAGWLAAFVVVTLTGFIAWVALSSGDASWVMLAASAGFLGVPGATLLVGLDWALSAETVTRRLGRIVVAVLVTWLVALVPIAFVGVFMIQTTAAA